MRLVRWSEPLRNRVQGMQKCYMSLEVGERRSKMNEKWREMQ